MAIEAGLDFFSALAGFAFAVGFTARLFATALSALCPILSSFSVAWSGAGACGAFLITAVAGAASTILAFLTIVLAGTGAVFAFLSGLAGAGGAAATGGLVDFYRHSASLLPMPVFSAISLRSLM